MMSKSSEKPLLGVVVVHYRNRNDTLRCLKSISRQKTTPAVRVYLIDCSRDFPAEEVPSSAYSLSLTCLPVENHGYGAGCNKGMHHAFAEGCACVIVTNADVCFYDGCLDALYHASLSEEKTLFAPVLLDGETKQIETLTQKLSYASARPLPSFLPSVRQNKDGITLLNELQGNGITSLETGVHCGCCLCFTAKQFEELKGFDESFFLYSEDVELSLRALQKGYSLKVLLKARLWHYHGGSTGETDGEINLYYHTRNRLLLAERCFPLFSRLNFSLAFPLMQAIKLLLLLLKGEKKKAGILKRALLDGLAKKQGKV